MTSYEVYELFRKYPKTPVFDHSNYQLFERIPAVPATSNNRGLTVYHTFLANLQKDKMESQMSVNLIRMDW